MKKIKEGVPAWGFWRDRCRDGVTGGATVKQESRLRIIRLASRHVTTTSLKMLRVLVQSSRIRREQRSCTGQKKKTASGGGGCGGGSKTGGKNQKAARKGG